MNFLDQIKDKINDQIVVSNIWGCTAMASGSVLILLGGPVGWSSFGLLSSVAAYQWSKAYLGLRKLKHINQISDLMDSGAAEEYIQSYIKTNHVLSAPQSKEFSRALSQHMKQRQQYTRFISSTPCSQSCAPAPEEEEQKTGASIAPKPSASVSSRRPSKP